MVLTVVTVSCPVQLLVRLNKPAVLLCVCLNDSTFKDLYSLHFHKALKGFFP